MILRMSMNTTAVAVVRLVVQSQSWQLQQRFQSVVVVRLVIQSWQLQQRFHSVQI